MRKLILKNHSIFSNIKPEYNKTGKIEKIENEFKKMFCNSPHAHIVMQSILQLIRKKLNEIILTDKIKQYNNTNQVI